MHMEFDPGLYSGPQMMVAPPYSWPLISAGEYAIRMAEGNDAARIDDWSAAFHYLVENGHYHSNRALPEGVEPMEGGHCFRNAYRLVHDQHLNYAEGVAGTEGLFKWHGWRITDDGQVVDPTWDHPEEIQYFGIAVRPLPYRLALLKLCHDRFMLLHKAAFVKRWGAMPDLLPVRARNEDG